MLLLPAVALVAVVLLGFVLPQRFVGTGVEEYEGKEKGLAREAISVAEAQFMGTSDHWYVTAARVSAVGSCSGPPDPDSVNFSAAVDLYTVFGVPYGTAEMSCEGEVRLRNSR